MPHQTFMENRVWKLVSIVGWGLSCAQLWELQVLLILLWVNVAPSVNKMYGSNSWLWDNQWQNLVNRSKSDPCSHDFFCLESHILSFPKVLQIPPESPCIYMRMPVRLLSTSWGSFGYNSCSWYCNWNSVYCSLLHMQDHGTCCTLCSMFFADCVFLE